MDRRDFLQSVALLFWHPWPTATPPVKASIYDYEDGRYLVAVGCLRCCLCPGSSTGSVLDFHVVVTDYTVPEMIRERRMAPSETLKKKLEEVGFQSRLEGDAMYPSLVARMTYFLTPNQVAEKLQRILRGCSEWSLLYYDFNSRYGRKDETTQLPPKSRCPGVVATGIQQSAAARRQEI